jgi:hypothetical protein
MKKDIQAPWEKFLFEEVESADIIQRYQLFQDLDGCLVNFEGPAIERLNEVMKEASKGLISDRKFLARCERSAEYLGGDLQNPPEIKLAHVAKQEGKPNPARALFYLALGNDEVWWSNLPWMDDGKELWEYVSRFNPIILTAPMQEKSSLGKLNWVKKNLNLEKDRVILSQTKYLYTSYEGKTGFLIDDMPKHLTPFLEKGGEGILHKSAASTIRELQRRGIK